nr:immunoglobulin light chain junction region [Macaca mulatta]MOV72943.1 immunoglobulin light chain junction region [Macaca mulatta]
DYYCGSCTSGITYIF